MSVFEQPLLARRPRTRNRMARLIAGLCAAALAANFAARDAAAQAAQVAEGDAAAQYVANLRRLLETRVLPDLKRGILQISSSRPPALTLDMTDDPSPYNVESRVAPDGSLNVRLSLGYVTLHDAALDAVALSAVLNNPRDLNRYLLYQLRLAHENHRRRAQGVSAHHARTFAELIGVEPEVTQRIFAQREWRLSRDRVQVDSLGWAVAHLLVRADPKLAGTVPLPRGAGAAHLAAASGWFPVPPVSTALGIATIERSPATPFDERAVLCDAADLMDAGISATRTVPTGRTDERNANLHDRVTKIRAQIAPDAASRSVRLGRNHCIRGSHGRPCELDCRSTIGDFPDEETVPFESGNDWDCVRVRGGIRRLRKTGGRHCERAAADASDVRRRGDLA